MLKHADTFGVFDQYGHITAGGLGEEGLYSDGTRFLSGLTFELEGVRPLYLDSVVGAENDLLTVTLTNPDLVTQDRRVLPLASLHVVVRKFLWQTVLHQHVVITHYGTRPIALAVTWRFAADYADIFEVRVPRTSSRGHDLEAVVGLDRVTLGYEGRDHQRRWTVLHFSPAASAVSDAELRYDLLLTPRQPITLSCDVACRMTAAAPSPPTFSVAQAAMRSDGKRRHGRQGRLQTSHAGMNAWINRASADLRTLTTDLSTGPYPYAGIPWFNTPFGRDGLIAAWQCLWLQPALARGVLAFLAGTQATDTIPEQDAEPGKILHETRTGELAAIGDIPFGRYYGSVDSTPLFVALAGAYFERTGDRPFVISLWPSIEAALAWIDQYGDRDGDGFVEYERRTSRGLLHQGWKDSDDAVVHRDGTAAVGPIAMCEVQGYVYAAWQHGAALARTLGMEGRAALWKTRADDLRRRFHETFWSEDLGTYALALDGRKAPLRVRTSNPGHCLFSGIVEPRHAPLVVRALFSEASFSGWGIRTLAHGEAAFNPMGYHTGGIWPHDNALIAEGLAQYGLYDKATTLLRSLFEASLHFDMQRMPELFCGFTRQDGEAPVPYPLACAPQAWAAGSVLLLLKASLGLQVDAVNHRITIRNPHLPEWLDEVCIRHLDVAGHRVDLSVIRRGHGLGVKVLRNEGTVAVVLP